MIASLYLIREVTNSQCRLCRRVVDGSDIWEAQFESECFWHAETYEYLTTRFYTGWNWHNLIPRRYSSRTTEWRKSVTRAGLSGRRPLHCCVPVITVGRWEAPGCILHISGAVRQARGDTTAAERPSRVSHGPGSIWGRRRSAAGSSRQGWFNRPLLSLSSW